MVTFFNSSSRNNRGFCMLDKPKHDMIESTSHLLAGEKFSANKQCELIFGEGTKNCPFTVTVSMHGRNYESVSGCRHASSRVFTLTNTLYNQIQTILYCIMHAILWFLPVNVDLDPKYGEISDLFTLSHKDYPRQIRCLFTCYLWYVQRKSMKSLDFK